MTYTYVPFVVVERGEVPRGRSAAPGLANLAAPGHRWFRDRLAAAVTASAVAAPTGTAPTVTGSAEAGSAEAAPPHG
ncbi:hypothetical protein ACGFZQ_02870 [Streptomyces sp. NPDC048254]|uniref:hypothetical protein n=1 Tax=Streptomyces sp. NPDC048254 TaxID=3365525 RepID=UPI0037158167